MPIKKKTSRRPAVRRPSARSAKPQRYVYSFNEIHRAERAARPTDGLTSLLGGKGAHLAEMTKLTLPVPPGFVLTTEACNAFLAGGDRFPKGMWEQVLAAVK